MKKLITSTCCALVVLSCTQQMEERSDRRYFGELFNTPFDGPPITTTPTNPDGGLVPGRVRDISPEESLRRKRHNENLPILFGQGAAGITMSTPRAEAYKVLATPIGSNGNAEFFQESIRIDWSNNQNRTPIRIIVFDKYKGPLDLGPKLGEVRMGTSINQMAEKLPTAESFEDLLLEIGAHFEDQDPASYNCMTAMTCRISENQDFLFLNFRQGDIYFDKSDNLKMYILVFVADRILRPFSSEPMLYGQSIAGMTRNSTKAEVEARLGQPDQVNPNGAHFYAGGSVYVSWNADNRPELFGALSSYRGIFPAGQGILSNRRMGSSFADLVVGDPSPNNLARRLYNLLENSEVDCIASQVCFPINSDDGLEIQMAGNIFGFSPDAERRLEYYLIIGD